MQGDNFHPHPKLHNTHIALSVLPRSCPPQLNWTSLPIHSGLHIPQQHYHVLSGKAIGVLEECGPPEADRPTLYSYQDVRTDRLFIGTIRFSLGRFDLK